MTPSREPNSRKGAPSRSKLFKQFLQEILFFFKTGLTRRAVRRVFRDLSNLYLTPSNPGKSEVMGLKVITSKQWLEFHFGEAVTYYVDRTELKVTTRTAVGLNGETDYLVNRQLWTCPIILRLVKQYRKHGIPFARNNEGVTYYAMPGEENL